MSTIRSVSFRQSVVETTNALVVTQRGVLEIETRGELSCRDSEGGDDPSVVAPRP
jgi:hypothetical protein